MHIDPDLPLEVKTESNGDEGEVQGMDIDKTNENFSDGISEFVRAPHAEGGMGIRGILLGNNTCTGGEGVIKGIVRAYPGIKGFL